MGRALLLGMALMCAVAAPASAQVDGGAPVPPAYEVREDGTLVIGGDVVVRCAEVGLLGDPGTDDPEILAQINESVKESARACEAAGFPTAVGPSVGSAASAPAPPAGAPPPVASASGPTGAVLPNTGGLPFAVLLASGAAASVAVGATSLALLAGRK